MKVFVLFWRSLLFFFFFFFSLLGANLKCCLLQTDRFGWECGAGMEPFPGGGGRARPQPGLFPPQIITGQHKPGASAGARVGETEWELFGVPIRCLLAQAELPQSRWLGGRHITLPVPGDFHSAGGDSPQPHTASEQTQEELAGDTGSGHHLQLSRNPNPSHSPRCRAGLHQPQPLVTPKVSFWETAGLVPGCLTPSDLLLQPHLQQSGTQSATGPKPLQPKLIPV